MFEYSAKLDGFVHVLIQVQKLSLFIQQLSLFFYITCVSVVFICLDFLILFIVCIFQSVQKVPIPLRLPSLQCTFLSIFVAALLHVVVAWRF